MLDFRKLPNQMRTILFFGGVFVCFGCLKMISSNPKPPAGSAPVVTTDEKLKFDAVADTCKLGGLAESLVPLGVYLTLKEEDCKLTIEWPSPPADPRECIEQSMLISAITSYYRHRSKMIRSLRPQDECGYLNSAEPAFRTETSAKEAVMVDSGEGSKRYDRMTYTSYESFVRISPHASMLITSVAPLITGCAGRCEFYSTFLSPEGFVLGTAHWTWTSVGRPPLADDLKGKVFAALDRPVFLQKGVPYLMLTIASVRADPQAEGGSVEIHTAGLEVLTRNPFGARISPVGPVDTPGATPSMVGSRGPLAFKLLGTPTSP